MGAMFHSVAAGKQNMIFYLAKKAVDERWEVVCHGWIFLLCIYAWGLDKFYCSLESGYKVGTYCTHDLMFLSVA
jgi:hypothetical protein